MKVVSRILKLRILFVIFYSAMLRMKSSKFELDNSEFFLQKSQNPPIERIVLHAETFPFEDLSSGKLKMIKSSSICDLQKESESLKVIEDLRCGGDSPIQEAAILVITIWLLQQQQANGFATAKTPLPPHMESARSLLFGKRPNRPGSSRSGSSLQMEENGLNENQNKEHKNSPKYAEDMHFADGSNATLINKNLDHILGRHGHQHGIDDIDQKATAEANKNLTPGLPKQIRTRISPENRDQLRSALQEKGLSTSLIPYPNYKLQQKPGRGYLCPKTDLFLGVDDKGIVRKAYISSPGLRQFLEANCK